MSLVLIVLLVSDGLIATRPEIAILASDEKHH